MIGPRCDTHRQRAGADGAAMMVAISPHDVPVRSLRFIWILMRSVEFWTRVEPE